MSVQVWEGDGVEHVAERNLYYVMFRYKGQHLEPITMYAEPFGDSYRGILEKYFMNLRQANQTLESIKEANKKKSPSYQIYDMTLGYGA